MESASRDSTIPMTSEEEEVKRNTDCVYFLASPLTCKKGNECEYRHSDGARVNPRDCWYWINGNCLNPKCSFRHPPLDGFLEGPGKTSAGPSGPSAQAAPSLHMPVTAQTTPMSYISSKQTTPCFYFQKGHCLKGDRCPFLHGPQTVGTTVPPPTQMAKVATNFTESQQSLLAATEPLQKCSTEHKFSQSQVNVTKPVEMLPPATIPTKAEMASKNGIMAKEITSPVLLDYDLPRMMPTSVPVMNGNSVGRQHSHPVQLLEDRTQNGKEADEFLGESSPGFDVLVDDELEDPDYYRNENDYGRNSDHGENHDEFDFKRFSDRQSLIEPYTGFVDYDQYGQVHEFGWEGNHRASSERILDRSPLPIMERKGLLRPESPDQIDRSDLRYRLSKQRRINGSRLTASPDCRGEFYRRDDWHVEGERRGSSHRDRQHFPHESSRRSRLQGRLKLPERPLADNTSDILADRDTERGRNSGRLSPGRPISFYQGKYHHHDRIKRMPEDFVTGGRNNRGPSVQRDEVDSINFAGPKSLAELKESKATNKEQPAKRKGVSHQQPEGSFSFEAPLPLTLIRKRKKEATSDSGAESTGKEETTQKKKVDQLMDSENEAAYTPRAVANGAHIVHQGQQSSFQKEDEFEVENGILTETMEEQEYSNFDQRDGDDDCGYGEPIEAGEFKRENENVDLEDEYLDDEDGDDFARRIGVMMS